MGKTGENSWLNAVKRAFIRSPVKENEKKNSRRGAEHELDDEEKKRGKRRWSLWKPSLLETTIQHSEAKNKASPISTSSTIHTRPANDESEQRRAIAVAMATTAAAEAAVATAQTAVEIIRLTRPNSILVKQQQREAAAVVVQTTFRGYLARKALRALKGVVMLQSLVRGYNVRKRAKMTLQCMQSLVRVQARVCDQRRRLSCEGSQSPMLVEPITRNLSRPADGLDEKSHTVEEIQVLIHKAKEFSLKHGNTLAHALTEQIWSEDDEGLTKQCTRNNTGLCDEKDKTKSFGQDNATPPLHKNSPSPRYQRLEPNYQTAETPTLRSNCFHRMSLSRSTDPTSRPNYMATTASVEARLRSQSAPRNRPSTPERDKTSSVKKRLSFPVPDVFNDIGLNSDDQKRDIPRCKNIHMVPICLEQRSNVSSYCTDSLADDVSSSTTCDTRRWLR